MNKGTPADPPYDSDPAQDAVLGKFEDAGFRYDGQCLWRGGPFATDELLALGAVLATKPAEPATITERELTFALNYHSDDSRINDADWKIARRYFEVIERNRGTHPSLQGHPTESAGKADPYDVLLGADPRLALLQAGNLTESAGKSPIAEPALTDEPADFRAWWESLAPAPHYPGIERRIALHAWSAALTHRSAAPSSGHPAQAVASSPEAADARPALSALLYAVGAAQTAAREGASRHDKAESGEAYEAAEKAILALADTQRSSDTAGSDEAKDRGAPPAGERDMMEDAGTSDRASAGRPEAVDGGQT